jgi:hypothetical protein
MANACLRQCVQVLVAQNWCDPPFSLAHCTATCSLYSTYIWTQAAHDLLCGSATLRQGMQEAQKLLLANILQHWLAQGLLETIGSRYRFTADSLMVALKPFENRTLLQAASFMPKADQQRMPWRQCPVATEVIREPKEAERVAATIVQHAKQASTLAHRVVGFDLEWRPDFTGKVGPPPPAIVQVCFPLSCERTCTCAPLLESVCGQTRCQ